MENLTKEETEFIYQVFMSINVAAADADALGKMRVIKSVQAKMLAAGLKAQAKENKP